MNIYVGNLAFTATEDDLTQAFSAHGTVLKATIIKDRENQNRSKGFGFVEMASAAEGNAAIAALNGKDLQGRPLKLNEARPREERQPRR